MTIGYVDIAGDPRHEPIKAYERIVLKQREPPFAGAQVGIDEAQALSRVLKIDFALERITVKSAEEVAPRGHAGVTERGIHFFIVDAPADAFKPLAAAVHGRGTVAVQRDGPGGLSAPRGLRIRDRPYHPEPRHEHGTRRLKYLVSRKWRDFLVLQGPLPADAARTPKAFEASVKKFGARIVATKPFQGRHRSARALSEQSLAAAHRRQPRLRCDLRRRRGVRFCPPDFIPTRCGRGRWSGAIDLNRSAWHWTWERNGAPQVNSRFQGA